MNDDNLIKIIHTLNINDVFSKNKMYSDSLANWKKLNPDFEIVVHTENEPDFMEFINNSVYKDTYINKGQIHVPTIYPYICFCYLQKYGGFFIEADMQFENSLSDTYENIPTLSVRGNLIYAENTIGPIYAPLNCKIVDYFVEHFKKYILKTPEIYFIPNNKGYIINPIQNTGIKYIHYVGAITKINENNEILRWNIPFKKYYVTDKTFSNKLKYINNDNVFIVALASNTSYDYKNRNYQRTMIFDKVEYIYKYIEYSFPYSKIEDLEAKGLIEFDITNPIMDV